MHCPLSTLLHRLPLRVTGEGIGPRVQLSFDKIDLGNVFIESEHSYEVVLANRGDIDAIFSVLSPGTPFAK